MIQVMRKIIMHSMKERKKKFAILLYFFLFLASLYLCVEMLFLKKNCYMDKYYTHTVNWMPISMFQATNSLVQHIWSQNHRMAVLDFRTKKVKVIVYMNKQVKTMLQHAASGLNRVYYAIHCPWQQCKYHDLSRNSYLLNITHSLILLFENREKTPKSLTRRKKIKLNSDIEKNK